MVPTKALCMQHLLGEHVELHMLASHLRKGRKLDGFLRKRLLEPQNMRRRHDAIARELERRGGNHNSPIDVPAHDWHGKVNVHQSYKDLRKRCKRCTIRFKKYGFDSRT